MTIPAGTPAPDAEINRPNIITPVGEESKQLPTEPFKSYMQGANPNPLLAPKTTQVSPFDLAHGQPPPAGPTMNTLLAQATQAQSTLGDLSTQLTTPNLKLKQSSKYILKNKLSSAKANIQSASAKMGVPPAPDTEVPPGAGPLQKFLAMVTDGQHQMEGAMGLLKGLKDKGESLSPGDMLLVQIKMNKAQQELEYSSILLSKAVDDIKMLMNIQL
jgi:hypothetical protein